jgi:phospholipase/lecithinase/hemolysin
LPDLGATPEAALLGLQAASHDASAQFNALIPLLLTTGVGLGLDVDFLDIASLMQSVIADATTNGGATYGITNISSPCAGFAYSNGASCDVSLFSDVLHPSARAHQIIGEAALAAVGVPEPATILLLAIGMCALVVRRRRA